MERFFGLSMCFSIVRFQHKPPAGHVTEPADEFGHLRRVFLKRWNSRAIAFFRLIWQNKRSVVQSRDRKLPRRDAVGLLLGSLLSAGIPSGAEDSL